jgi:hypothetical protein
MTKTETYPKGSRKINSQIFSVQAPAQQGAQIDAWAEKM